MSWSEDTQEALFHIDVSAIESIRSMRMMNCGCGVAQLLKSFYRYEGKSRFDVSNGHFTM